MFLSQKRILVIMAGLTLALCLGSGSVTLAMDKVNIGMIAPMSGGAAEFSSHAIEGAKMAVEDFNAKGGIPIQGKNLKIELVLYDEKCDPTTAVAAAEKMISRDNVLAICGAICSSASLASREVSHRNKVVQVTPLSLHPDITGPGYPYMFRLCNTVGMYAEPFVEFVADKLKAKSVAMLVVTDDYGMGAVKTYSELYKKKGVKIAAVEYMKHGETDLYTQLTKIKNSQPEAVFFGSQENAQLVGGLKQMKELGYKGIYLGNSVWATDDIVRLAGKELLEGVYTESPAYELVKEKPPVQEWLKRYKSRTNKEGNAFSLLSYQAIQLLANVLKEANTFTDKEKIRLAMTKADLRGLVGFYGDPNFDKNGQAHYYLGALQYQNGKRVVAYHRQ
jgi:branched-chain amino acid transport system substrate-binding protein